MVTHMMREVEHWRAEAAEVECLRFELGWCWIALRGYETKPQNPFPLLSGEEIIDILHPPEPRGRRSRRERR